MRILRTGPTAFSLEFEDADEVLREYRSNLSMGGLRLETADTLPLHSTLTVTLRGPFGAVEELQARVVAPLPGGVALAIGTPSKDLPERLLARAGGRPAAGLEEAVDAVAADSGTEGRVSQNMWDRIRALGRMEKILLSQKAERTERALLLQDNDPQVLYTLLKNPRLTVDEVVRIAKSPYLTFQMAEAMMKSTLWIASLDVRVALVHNPKTPPTFALRLLPTLPEAEVKVIARGAATSMALKTAALRRLQTGS
jgi:hypothetical protein